MRWRATRTVVVVSLLVIAQSSGQSFASGEPRDRGEALQDQRATRTGPKQLPPLVAVAEADALARALDTGLITSAQFALERVRALFDLEGARARFGSVDRPDPRSATLLMRDLAIRVDQLAPMERATALRILARPTDGAGDPLGDGYSVLEAPPFCAAHTCIHYVTTTPDAPPPGDIGGSAGVPDWVETVSGIAESVWSAEVGTLGYRAPKSDMSSTNNGGNALLDIYLSNIGGNGLFGYCATDDPNAHNGYGFFDVSAYCVFDDDYAPSQYGFPNPSDPLKVTAAHELFHAVQFAYDVSEDGWLMEGTAAWVEDEIYDGVNDNRMFLGSSALSHPLVPLDKNVAPRWYGTWLFWRFLVEYFGGASPDPSIVRAVWKRADGSPVGRDMYSTEATAQAVAARAIGGKPWRFRWAFADFAAWNARPGKYYEEGKAYPAAKIAKTVTLSRAVRSTRSSVRLDHLSNWYGVVRRRSGLSATAKLRVTIDGPAYGTGPEASVVVVRRSGAAGYKVVRLNRLGKGSITVAFGSTVARVVVIMTNASTRYRDCYSGLTTFACNGGTPLDQDRVYAARATVV